MVHRMYLVGSELRVEIAYGDVLAFITPNGIVKDLSFGDAYWFAHKALEASQKLAHSAEACPERTRGVEIRSWAAAGSWREYSVKTTDYAGTPGR